MKLRQKVIFVGIVPLVVALCAIALFVLHQATALADQQRATIQQAYLASKEAELQHYVELATRAIAPLLERGDAQAQEEAKRILGTLSFGDDGYFFVYDMQGLNLMHPRQPELVGRNLWNLREPNGDYTIRKLVARAQAGGGLERYTWSKPTTRQPAPKLGYVVPIRKWNWMLGTGIYLDDVDAALKQVDEQESRNIRSTMLWIAAIAILAVAAVASAGLALNISESRVADAKLKVLTQRVVESQEEERARLSRDLHDGISQWLVSVKLQIEAGIIRMANPGRQEEARAGFEHTVDQLNNVLGEVRRISHALRPAILDDLGLAAALEHLAREAVQGGSTPVFFTASGSFDSVPDVANTVLFRIAQEALTNIERHAGATRVDMALACEGSLVTLSIADDGHGFDPVDIAIHPKRGIGLRNMMERMDAIGGQLNITSSGSGTTVLATVPLKGMS